MNEYQRSITALFARTGTTAKLGLERTQALLDQLGNPERELRAFHVAGTNGKGSVVAMLHALLRARGVSVGRYTSPHLLNFRERIVVDEEQISEGEVLGFLARWEAEADRLGATFFELTTVLAFDYFARAGVDVALVETGLGGRLDATNVLTPLVSGITSVARDHTEYLGESLRDIASEKAGILKPGVPAVLGPLVGEAREEVERRARAVQVASLLDAQEEFPATVLALSPEGTRLEVTRGDVRRELTVGLVGSPQAANTSVALTMLQAAGYNPDLEQAARVLPGVHLAGRFEVRGKFIVDVAHNVDGIGALRRTLDDMHLPRPLVSVVGILRDKEWLEMLRLLAPVADQIIATVPASAPAGRVWDLRDVAAQWQESWGRLTTEPSLQNALSAAEAAGATVLVTGSFYTVGECLQLLEGAERL